VSILHLIALRKMNASQIIIGVVGSKNTGKTSLINSAWEVGAPVGNGPLGTTTACKSYYLVSPGAESQATQSLIDDGTLGVCVVDYPGFNDSDKNARPCLELLKEAPSFFLHLTHPDMLCQDQEREELQKLIQLQFE
jgi:ribosome biogenesis GTPase A